MIEALKAWRSANGFSQQRLAGRLGVSQATVSRWEAGIDAPSLEVAGRIRALLDPGTQHAVALEELFVGVQESLNVLFDLDGARLLATSQGYVRRFPHFSRLIGESFANRLVGETRVIYEDTSLHSSIMLGEIALMMGTTERHVDHDHDPAPRHHWTICFRKSGTRVLGNISFDLCDDAAETRLGRIIRTDELGAGV
jgi:transcriptional regulator with XRE-family HTH domain